MFSNAILFLVHPCCGHAFPFSATELWLPAGWWSQIEFCQRFQHFSRVGLFLSNQRREQGAGSRKCLPNWITHFLRCDAIFFSISRLRLTGLGPSPGFGSGKRQTEKRNRQSTMNAFKAAPGLLLGLLVEAITLKFKTRSSDTRNDDKIEGENAIRKRFILQAATLHLWL